VGRVSRVDVDDHGKGTLLLGTRFRLDSTRLDSDSTSASAWSRTHGAVGARHGRRDADAQSSTEGGEDELHCEGQFVELMRVMD
jgi:hypothetical protein